MASRLEQDMVAVVAQIGAGAATHVFGAQELVKRASPPRVVWERSRASFESPSIRYGNNPKPLVTLAQTVAIHLWATSDEQLETLLANEIIGISRIANGSYSIDSFEPGGVNEEWVRLGFCGVLTVTARHSVEDEVIPVGQIDSIEQDPDVDSSDEWLEAGDYVVAPTMTFDAGTSTIVKSTGSWTELTTSTFTLSGTESNDGTFTVDSVVGGTVTVLETLVDETIRISQVEVTAT